MSDTTPRDQLAQIIDRGMCPETPDDVRSTEDAIADAVIAAGWRPPARVVTTVEEAEALQDGTLIVDRDGDGGQVCDHHVRYPENDIVSASAAINRYGPFTILWEPEEGE